ncbi:hypothetical protein PGT21_000546 [Puccinia graminis f. sp. tritici]|uniref:Uncharacterized protein n=1 Tax=Puccinia graminis f. sp. tritici TaxID=56615 RepID=A0A5B0N0L3_PUCGR|nr:hypothetical protein PGT21_000546 [Puccinia graminis f. sp. tritici]
MNPTGSRATYGTWTRRCHNRGKALTRAKRFSANHPKHQKRMHRKNAYSSVPERPSRSSRSSARASLLL